MNNQIGLLQTAMSAMFLAMAAGFMLNDVPHMLEYEGKRAKLVNQYGSWAVGRAESVCPLYDDLCVERESSRLLGAYRRGFTS